ncbi:phage tail protein [Aureibacter tunicatorum]|uniref:Microcystin-dependent protein n=1 Tax=Aureibacter tunicatorum TaxID=866807 RepID=A0AAE3XMN8_9BACT|nr:phage tail protein [Aureibacter tunicatorum]MDR6239762.1 microcystin-dependent protein [Aureibacter tunicatorum]BDD04237.1 hypothetical protein AUTU_17200 [Aureibacter tunicatorum]
MKNLLLLLLVALSFGAYSQQGVSFQGIARDQEGKALSSQQLEFFFSVGESGKTAVYSESKVLDTDAFGVFSHMIGSEKANEFNALDFSVQYNLKVSYKKDGNTYVLSDSPLNYVPYTYYAEKAQHSNTATTATANGVPVGTIMPFAGDKNKVPSGWLVCDGSSYSKTNSNYVNLFNTIGTNWGGDGSNFNVPDLRGLFLRGVSDASGADPDRNNRSAIKTGGNTGNKVGSYQADQFKSHNHGNGNYNLLLQRTGNHTSDGQDNSSNEPDVVNTAAIQARGGNETRPRNAYVHYIIKY